ncbi:MAG: hypothetical protein E7252_09285 [Lachnospira sp.]|nr:hypothetical protein [Lachnospira sp.]
MISYLEAKAFICELLRGEPTSTTDDYDIKYTATHYYRSNGDNNGIILSDSELKTLYDELQSYQFDEDHLYNPTYYEVAIDFASQPIGLKWLESLETLTDFTNGYSYKIDLVSPLYALNAIICQYEKRTASRDTLRNYSIDRIRRGPLSRVYTSENYPNTFSDLLPQLMREYSIRICSETPTSKEQFDSLKTSFSFEFMLNF